MSKYKILFEPFENGYNVYTGTTVEEYELLCFIEKGSLYENTIHYESIGAEVFIGNKANV